MFHMGGIGRLDGGANPLYRPQQIHKHGQIINRIIQDDPTARLAQIGHSREKPFIVTVSYHSKAGDGTQFSRVDDLPGVLGPARKEGIRGGTQVFSPLFG